MKILSRFVSQLLISILSWTVGTVKIGPFKLYLTIQDGCHYWSDVVSSFSCRFCILPTQFLHFLWYLSTFMQFIGACKQPLVIATELLPGMSLRKYLISIRPKLLDLHMAISFSLDIARAMDCLHANGIIHRDLKPGTVWKILFIITS